MLNTKESGGGTNVIIWTQSTVRAALCVRQGGALCSTKKLFRPLILLYSAKAGYVPDYNDYSDTDDDDDNDDFDDNNADDNNADDNHADDNNGEDDDDNDHNHISRDLTV